MTVAGNPNVLRSFHICCLLAISAATTLLRADCTITWPPSPLPVLLLLPFNLVLTSWRQVRGCEVEADDPRMLDAMPPEDDKDRLDPWVCRADASSMV
jgi:hypothetical protein